MSTPAASTAAADAKAKENAAHTYSAATAFRKAQSSAWAALLGGTIHGMMELPFVVPIEASITQTQLNAKSFFWNVKDLIKRREIYRSLNTTAVGLIPKCWIHYAWLNFYIALLVPSGNLREATKQQSATVGLLTGGSEVIFLTPINFVKFRMQRPEWEYKSMLDCISRVYKEEGPTAYWKGTSAVFMRNSICMLGMVGCYNTVEEALPAIPFKPVAAGAICGIIGSFFSYPFEMLRAARQHNLNFYDEIVAGGPRRMLAGYVPGAARIVLHSAALGVLIPRMKEMGTGTEFLKKSGNSFLDLFRGKKSDDSK